MPYIYSNRASAQLAQSLDPNSTTMIVQTGQGVPFPVPSGANVAQLTLIASDGTHEIVTNTSRVGDNFVIVRGQEGTPAGTFSVGSRVELRLTAETLNKFLSKTGGTMEGPIDFGFHRNVGFVSYTAQVEYSAVRSLCGYDFNGTSNIVFPGGGAFPQIGGSKILTWAFLGQLIFVYYGGIEFLPAYLKICDGTRGTPDLRDRFVICAGPVHPQFSGGGNFSIYVAPSGNHNHDVSGTQLEWMHMAAMQGLTKAFTPVSFTANQAGNKTVLADAEVQGYGSPGAHHGHFTGQAGVHQHEGNFKPPYYALYYVMLNELAFN